MLLGSGCPVVDHFYLEQPQASYCVPDGSICHTEVYTELFRITLI